MSRPTYVFVFYKLHVHNMSSIKPGEYIEKHEAMLALKADWYLMVTNMNDYPIKKIMQAKVEYLKARRQWVLVRRMMKKENRELLATIGK